jgi:Holliday junction resolvasome RuvABC endonuclease subunit
MPPAPTLRSRRTYVGLDLSLTGSGVAILRRTPANTWESPYLETIRCPHKGPVTKLFEAERLRHIINTLDALGVFRDATLVGIEDYAYGIGGAGADGQGRTNCMFQLGELGGCVRFHLFSGNVPWIEIPIQSNKKFGTGSGSASKEQVAEAMSKMWRIPQFTKKQLDASDALSLASVAAFRDLGELPGIKGYRFWTPLCAQLEVTAKENRWQSG